jgi:hypothetical protein
VTWEVHLYREDEAGYRLCCEPFGDSVKCLYDEGFSVPVAKCGLLRGRRNWVFGWGRMRTQLFCSVDAAYASHPDLKSRTGYCFALEDQSKGC